MGRLGPGLEAPSLGEAPLPPRTPSGWGLGLGVSGLGLSVGAPTSAPSASQRPLRGAQVPLHRPPWAGFVTFLRLVPSPGNWDKVTALQGRPKDQVSGGAAPGPALTEWGGGQGHTVSSDSASCWGSHACYTGKLKQKTCRAWSQPAETQRASCELQKSPRPSMRRNLKHQLASPPISRGGN